jgi:hypothetical protein
MVATTNQHDAACPKWQIKTDMHDSLKTCSERSLVMPCKTKEDETNSQEKEIQNVESGHVFFGLVDMIEVAVSGSEIESLTVTLFISHVDQVRMGDRSTRFCIARIVTFSTFYRQYSQTGLTETTPNADLL